MKNAKIIFYECNEVYKIFNELNDYYQFNMNKISKKKELDLFIKNESNYLIISTKYLEDKNRSDIENNLTGEELDEA